MLRLSKSLGISAEEAGTLNSALGIIGSDADTYVGTFQRFSMQLRRNEEGMNKMGLETRDSAGHLKDANEVFTQGLQIVSSYKPGIDQTAAAQKLFGKSIDDVMKLQKLNNQVMEEAKEKNEALGLVVTQDNVEANKKYKLAMHDVNEVMTAVMKTIGDAVMPAFTELAHYLASTGPAVISVFKGALTGLMVVFRGIQVVVKVLVAVVSESFNYMADQAQNFGNLFKAVFIDHSFTKAADAAGAMKDRAVQAFVNVRDAAVDAAKDAKDAFEKDMGGLWGPKVAASGTAGKGTKQMGDLKDKKDKPDKPRMGEWEAALEERKVAYEKENDLRELSKQAELKYWQDIAASTDLSATERVAITKKVATEQLAVLKEQRQQEDGLESQRIDRAKARGMEQIAMAKEANQNAVAIGKMTTEQSLKEDQKLEDQRYQITKQGVTDRLLLLQKDPTKNVVALQKLNDELDAVEAEHALKQKEAASKIQQDQAKGWQDLFSKIGNSFASTIQGLMTHQMTWAQAVKSMFQQTLSAVANFISQILAKKLAAFATEKALNLAGITGDAAKAGSGAASSVANIPYVGPILAIAAMAAVFAATMGMQSNVKSARGGYDIPSGMNPMVQTHEEEMILPKEQANAVRDMAQNGGNGGLTINATPMPGGFFMMHQDEILKVVGNAKRYGRF